jgi:small conductance mechanosensitive channel
MSSGVMTLGGTTLDATKLQQLNDLVGRVAGLVAIENNVTKPTDVAERLGPVVDRLKVRLA